MESLMLPDEPKPQEKNPSRNRPYRSGIENALALSSTARKKSTSFKSTTSSSAKKRQKQREFLSNDPTALLYPTLDEIAVPLQPRVEALVEEAISINPNGEQSSLVRAGLLSFSQVILPSLVFPHDQALQLLERKTKPDAPELKDAVIQVRRTTLHAVRAAMRAAEVSSQQRIVAYRKNLLIEVEQRRNKRQKEAESMAKQLELDRPIALRAARKKFPANQAMYREHAFLMDELAKLETEEKNWMSAERELEEQNDSSTDSPLAPAGAERAIKENYATGDDSVEISAAATQVTILQQELESMKMSMFRIQSALEIVQKLVVEAEELRTKLYQDFSKEQFAGYPGVHQPRGLLKALSQSQTQNSLDSDE